MSDTTDSESFDNVYDFVSESDVKDIAEEGDRILKEI